MAKNNTPQHTETETLAQVEETRTFAPVDEAVDASAQQVASEESSSAPADGATYVNVAYQKEDGSYEGAWVRSDEVFVAPAASAEEAPKASWKKRALYAGAAAALLAGGFGAGWATSSVVAPHGGEFGHGHHQAQNAQQGMLGQGGSGQGMPPQGAPGGQMGQGGPGGAADGQMGQGTPGGGPGGQMGQGDSGGASGAAENRAGSDQSAAKQKKAQKGQNAQQSAPQTSNGQ